MTTSKRSEVIIDPGKNDVLCGRGGRIMEYPGNVKFQHMIDCWKERYSSAPCRTQKAAMAIVLVRLWRKQSPPGRFLIRADPSKGNNSPWRDIGNRKAKQKVMKCLREGSSLQGVANTNATGAAALHGQAMPNATSRQWGVPSHHANVVSPSPDPGSDTSSASVNSNQGPGQSKNSKSAVAMPGFNPVQGARSQGTSSPGGSVSATLVGTLAAGQMQPQFCPTVAVRAPCGNSGAGCQPMVTPATYASKQPNQSCALAGTSSSPQAAPTADHPFMQLIRAAAASSAQDSLYQNTANPPSQAGPPPTMPPPALSPAINARGANNSTSTCANATSTRRVEPTSSTEAITAVNSQLTQLISAVVSSSAQNPVNHNLVSPPSQVGPPPPPPLLPAVISQGGTHSIGTVANNTCSAGVTPVSIPVAPTAVETQLMQLIAACLITAAQDPNQNVVSTQLQVGPPAPSVPAVPAWNNQAGTHSTMACAIPTSAGAAPTSSPPIPTEVDSQLAQLISSTLLAAQDPNQNPASREPQLVLQPPPLSAQGGPTASVSPLVFPTPSEGNMVQWIGDAATAFERSGLMLVSKTLKDLQVLLAVAQLLELAASSGGS
ncbi:Transcriptional regulator [Seminavis robusta]|uniref:Transcriptional regulator n=1 Tax=Seminavis robusta TaxID=568900 RepID=A0A9N8EX70_9STRA|nr:Transcriptional regulator [Seminavis robusta]|eukprot:Sro1872_g302760.1 Transcriptional regulator (604) ;mRNA; f:1502-3560